MAILTIKGLVKRFGGIRALDDVDIAVDAGELVGLIGPNGSGKTTLFNCITGELRPESGEICFEETPITGRLPYQIARLGIVRTYQQTEIFASLSAFENLLVAGQERQDQGFVPTLFATRRVRAAESGLRERASDIIDLLGLTHQTNERAGSLSYGQRKLLAIGMGLMTDPPLLLLDEPTAAVNPTAIGRIADLLRKLRDKRQTILLIEHNLPFVMELCARVIVLDAGRKLAEGRPEIVRNDARVVEAYFGA